MCSVAMLKKVLSGTQWVSSYIVSSLLVSPSAPYILIFLHWLCSRWVALVMLTAGVALTQLSKTQEISPDDTTSTARVFTGFVTVMIAICLSGFAGECIGGVVSLIIWTTLHGRIFFCIALSLFWLLDASCHCKLPHPHLPMMIVGLLWRCVLREDFEEKQLELMVA